MTKTAKTKTKKNGKTAVKKEVDLRSLPKAERPKPKSGQSAAPFTLPAEDLTADESKLVGALNGKGTGLRAVLNVTGLSKSTKMTNLTVRNTLRRLVPSGWVERVEEVLTDDGEVQAARGHYRVSERGRKRL